MTLLSYLTSYYTLIPLLLPPLLVLIHDIYTWYRLPPGPLPLPFIGNKFSLPKTKPWVQFEKWGQQYGPLFTIWVGRRPTIVISDPNVAVDLMEKRSSKYSSRPRFVVMGEIYSDMATILVQPYGKEWSIRRKLLHHALTPRALNTYKERQEAEASRLMYGILQNPASWEKQFDRFTSSVVFTVAYGHRVDSLDAQVIRDRLTFMQYMASLNVPGAFLAESIPALKYLPNWLAPWKKEIQDKGKEEAAANVELLHLVQSEMRSAKAGGHDIPDSLAKSVLELRDKEKDAFPLNDRNLSYTPASLFGAGSDTTASTLCSGVLALLTHPQALRAAQAELDAVVGPDRTPTFEDEANLPYLRALIKEILRWRPVAVLGGTPHSSTQTDIYNQYRIPADTTILGNTWAINRNTDFYPEPDSFVPERWLDPSDPRCALHLAQGVGRVKKHPSPDGHSVFGWGRRICPGAGLAWNSLVASVGKLVWGFEILPLEGRTIENYDTGMESYTEGFNIRPKSFECVIRVRSEAHRKVLEKERERAEGIMARFEAFA